MIPFLLATTLNYNLPPAEQIQYCVERAETHKGFVVYQSQVADCIDKIQSQ